MEKNKKNKDEIEWISKSTVKSFGYSDKMIQELLPPPKRVPNPYYKSAGKMQLWDKKIVEAVMLAEENRKAFESVAKRRQAIQKTKERKNQEIIKLFQLHDIVNIVDRGKKLKRHFVLHIGPTNSGKTHEALDALMYAETGVYLGPLRLLAMEAADRLNAAGCPCTLMTGEETIPVENAKHISSTIEMMSVDATYKVGVIDEAQMLSDTARGHAWTKAILLLNAEEIHICLAPEAEEAVIRLVNMVEAEYCIVRHNRLTELKAERYIDELFTGHPKVKIGDALIVFSRSRVLSLASDLQHEGYKVSIIYGALPPLSRREEARRFCENETDILVTTDAIGMGLNLPIKRVQFVETTKYDGRQMRRLNSQEYKQIGGRAGRFGIYDCGTVCAKGMSAQELSEKISLPSSPVANIIIPFPDNVVDSTYSLDVLFKTWEQMPVDEGFVRQDISEMRFLLGEISAVCLDKKQLVYSAIQCSVNQNDLSQVYYWLNCFYAAYYGRELPNPTINLATLESAEESSRMLDIFHQMMRKIGHEVNLESERQRICDAINEFLIKRNRRKYP